MTRYVLDEKVDANFNNRVSIMSLPDGFVILLPSDGRLFLYFVGFGECRVFFAPLTTHEWITNLFRDTRTDKLYVRMYINRNGPGLRATAETFEVTSLGLKACEWPLPGERLVVDGTGQYVVESETGAQVNSYRDFDPIRRTNYAVLARYDRFVDYYNLLPALADLADNQVAIIKGGPMHAYMNPFALDVKLAIKAVVSQDELTACVFCEREDGKAEVIVMDLLD